MKASKITIGRLFNCGNYEHVRIEITADIGDGQSASNAFVAIESAISAMKPRSTAAQTWDGISRKQSELIAAKQMPLAEFERKYGQPSGGPAAFIARLRDEIKRESQVLADYDRMRSNAIASLDDLGSVPVIRLGGGINHEDLT